MISALNKYELLLTSWKWNTISPEQYQIILIISVVEEIKDNNLKLANSVNRTPEKGKGKLNRSQFFNSCNRYIIKVKGKVNNKIQAFQKRSVIWKVQKMVYNRSKTWTRIISTGILIMIFRQSKIQMIVR